MISRPYGARIGSPSRSIPPSRRITKRNTLGIYIFYRGRVALDVTVVTCQRNGDYSTRSDLGSWCWEMEVKNAKRGTRPPRSSKIRARIPQSGRIWTFAENRVEASLYFRGLPGLRELRVERKPPSVHGLCSHSSGSTGVSIDKIPLPSHRAQCIGRDAGLPLSLQRSRRDRGGGGNVARGDNSASGSRARGCTTRSQQTVGLSRRNTRRNTPLSKAAPEVCKPSVSDRLSLDRGRQVFAISARSPGSGG